MCVLFSFSYFWAIHISRFGKDNYLSVIPPTINKRNSEGKHVTFRNSEREKVFFVVNSMQSSVSWIWFNKYILRVSGIVKIGMSQESGKAVCLMFHLLFSLWDNLFRYQAAGGIRSRNGLCMNCNEWPGPIYFRLRSWVLRNRSAVQLVT